MVEQAAVNRKVEGSSPSLGASLSRKIPQRGSNPRGHKAPVELYARSRAKHERSGISLQSKREPLPRSQILKDSHRGD